MANKTPKYEISKVGVTRFLVGTSYESGEPTSFNVVWADTPDEAVKRTCDANLYSSTSITVLDYGYTLGRWKATEPEE